MSRVYKKNKIEKLENELESQTKLITIKRNDMQSTMRSTVSDKLENIQETIFDDGETKVLVNAKFFLDINKDTTKFARQIEDINKI